MKLSILSVQVSALPLPECVLMLDQIKHVFTHKKKSLEAQASNYSIEN